MFKSLRRGSKSIVLTIMFAIISLSFIFAFGSGADGCRAVDPSQRVATYAVLVDGKDRITLGDYSEKRKDIMLRTRGMNLGENMLNEMILNELINDYFLVRYSKNLNLEVSEEERDRFIENTEYFKTDGKFDFNKYKNIVQNYFNTTLVQHEKNTKRKIIVNKVRKILTSPINISDKEVWELFEKYEKNAIISYVEINPVVTIDEKQLNEYIKNNEKSLKDYYEKHQDKYMNGEQIRCRHILFMASEKNSQEVVDKKVKEIEKKLKAGVDFSKLVEKYSEGPSKLKGGDLGFFAKGKMEKPFEDAAFALKNIGDISKVVKTRFGHHIIQLTGKRKPSTKKYVEVKNSIARILYRKSQYATFANKLFEEIKTKYNELDSLEKVKELYPNSSQIKDSDKIYTYKDSIEGIGDNKEMVEETFKTKENSLFSKPYKVGNKVVIAKLKKFNDPDKKKFEEQKASMKKNLSEQEKILFLKSWLDSQRKNSKIEIDVAYQTEKK